MHGFVPLRLRHSAPAPREMRVSAAAFVDDRFGRASTLTRINADTSALRRVSGRVQRRRRRDRISSNASVSAALARTLAVARKRKRGACDT